MRESTFTFQDPGGVTLHAYQWLPEEPPQAVVQIAHGMQEHAGRYRAAAEALTGAGYAAYAHDHRGHGRSGPDPARPGWLGEGGYEAVLGGLRALFKRIRVEHPALSVFLLGHSWGSFLAQRWAQQWGEELAGLVLSGSEGGNPAVAPGVALARLVVALRGAERQAGLLELLTVGGLNRRFAPGETGKEWLSRDPAVPRAYLADPLCAQPFPNQFFLEMLRLMRAAWAPSNEAALPRALPVYVFSGTEDPVSPGLKGLRALLARYDKMGMRDVSHRFYEGGRHEMLNETNRDEVLRDLIGWLATHLPR